MIFLPLVSLSYTILSPQLKCPGYRVFSSFSPNGGVIAFICSDVYTSHLTQLDLSSPGFQLIWLKTYLPSICKFICTLYRSRNSNNHDLLFDHLFKSTDAITLQSPLSKIIILGDFNVYIPDWLAYSSNITTPAGRDAEAFATVNDMSQFISEHTRIPDGSGDEVNTLNLFLHQAQTFTPNPL